MRSVLQGLLTAKVYADGSQVTYAYNQHLGLETRTWARDGGTVTTTYLYDASSGQLTDINYSDTTPDVQFVRDRLGRPLAVFDGLGETRFAYSDTLQLISEVIPASLYEGFIQRIYDDGSGGGVPGRYVGLNAFFPESYQIGYQYDGLGRLSGVNGTTLPSGGVEYSYLANSDLIERLEYKDGTQATIAETIRGYEPSRNLLASVENKWSIGVPPVTVSMYAYQNDNLGRRTSVVRTGDAFALTSSGDHFDSYGYNDRNELTGSTGYFGTDPGQTGNPMLSMGRDLDYSYDPIGNRIDASIDAGTPTTYSANNLNQYTATSDPAESFSFDLDGNMTEDGDFAYTWDAENRLIGVGPVSAPVAGDKQLSFTYDYRGRRVRKVVEEFDGSAWSVISDTRFVYDGWNVILELDGLDDNETIRRYAWGMDLSGTLQGAGGIGGLLANEDTAGTIETSDDLHHLYFYDANGNVGQLVDWFASAGTIAAHYEYDPYGNALVSAGAYATANTFRFSTKYFNAETGLYNYGYRFYSPRLGRWLNRDPEAERGGMNLYRSTNNNPLYWIDPDGREPQPSDPQNTNEPSDGATSQPSQPKPPSSQPSEPKPKEEIDNFDPTTHVGSLVQAHVGKTLCDIFIVRQTNAGGLGHTSIVWQGGSVGYVSGDKSRSDQDELGNANATRRALSIYAVKYCPSAKFPEETVSFKYGAGPAKGKCCPEQADCQAIRDCLAAQIRTSCNPFHASQSNLPIDERYNCNSFAREALTKCCLCSGRLIVNNYTGRWNPFHPDSEGNNLIGWWNWPPQK